MDSGLDLTGNWSFNLRGAPAGDGVYHAWIACIPTICEYPDGDAELSVGEPGVSRDAITVGAYVTKWCWETAATGSQCFNPAGEPRVGAIGDFSGVGPTRDGRLKPDIAAPGQGIASTRSNDASYSASQVVGAEGRYVVLKGTSFSTPHVTGAVALLLARNPNLDAAQIKTLLQQSAIKDQFTSAGCNVTWGCGKLNMTSLAPAILTVPELVTPEDGAVLDTSTPLFVWEPSSENVADYVLQVSSGDIEQGPFDIVRVINPATEYQSSGDDALEDGIYAWRVTARDATGDTAESEARDFTIDAVSDTITVTKEEDTDGICEPDDCSLSPNPPKEGVGLAS